MHQFSMCHEWVSDMELKECLSGELVSSIYSISSIHPTPSTYSLIMGRDWLGQTNGKFVDEIK